MQTEEVTYSFDGNDYIPAWLDMLEDLRNDTTPPDPILLREYLIRHKFPLDFIDYYMDHC
ncbi:hypothetical protein IL59_0209460 [Brucella suis bv. 4 str. 40]|nr:hypothetical protein IL59_0209460 [Brucella suis bv. 4 str. 40]